MIISKYLENSIKDLYKQVNNLTKMIRFLGKEKFGSSSEKPPKSDIHGQLSLFNEAEQGADVDVKEPIKKSV